MDTKTRHTSSGNGKRQRIIKSSQALFASKGFKNCSISEIARDANVVDSILYHYFIDKEDLLFAACADQLKNAKKEVEFHLHGIVDPMSKLGKVIWYHLHMNDFDSENAEILKHLLLECQSKKQFYKHESFAILKTYSRIIRNILDEGVQQGIFNPSLNTSLVMEMIFGWLDAESLSRFVYNEVEKTVPDFERIMMLVSAIVCNPGAPVPETNKRTAILASAKQVFAEHGYNKATIAGIAQQAKVAEGTIYEYFKNKKELFLAISNEQFKQYKKSMTEFLDAKNPLVNLRKIIYLHFLHISSDPEFLMIYLHDLLHNKQFYATDAFSHYMDYIADLDRILDEGKKQGVFNTAVNNRVFRNLFLGTFSHLSVRWFVINSRTAEEMILEFNQASDLLCQAVRIQDAAISRS